MNESELRDALARLVRGDGVRRGTHSLRIDGSDQTPLFLEALRECGFHSCSVKDVPIQPGQRVAAFFLKAGLAHFGWVFWEVFSMGHQRKIFGSAERNHKGDWAVLLGLRKEVYVNLESLEEIDLENPPGL